MNFEGSESQGFLTSGCGKLKMSETSACVKIFFFLSSLAGEEGATRAKDTGEIHGFYFFFVIKDYWTFLSQ